MTIGGQIVKDSAASLLFSLRLLALREISHNMVRKLKQFCAEVIVTKKQVLGLPWWFSGKEFACQCRRHRFNP